MRVKVIQSAAIERIYNERIRSRVHPRWCGDQRKLNVVAVVLKVLGDSDITCAGRTETHALTLFVNILRRGHQRLPAKKRRPLPP